jgi:hypothetical protein
VSADSGQRADRVSASRAVRCWSDGHHAAPTAQPFTSPNAAACAIAGCQSCLCAPCMPTSDGCFAGCSCEVGIPQNLAGMLATTWACGALAIVQKLNVMPSSLHPCNKLLAGARSLTNPLLWMPQQSMQ